MRILPFFIILSLLISSIEGSGKTRSTKNNRTMKQKLTKFTVYWQDIVSGTHPTAVTIIPPASNSSSSGTFFGMTRMIDNALTTEPDLKSSVVGRAQGFYASASQSPPMCFMMAMNFAFTSGKYNGSSLTLMGSNPAMSEVRELPVLGGSGLFRFARGYARLSTRWLDLETGDATVQYNVTVLHYG